MMPLHQVYLSLGSNQGDRQQLISRAIQRIRELVGDVDRQSTLYETEPWGFRSDHLFLNAAIRVQTALCPRCVLERTQQIERELGRMRKTTPSPRPANGATSSASLTPLPQYSDRPIDIDILLYDNLTVDEPDLQIPHPLMHERDFVMTPLREIME